MFKISTEEPLGRNTKIFYNDKDLNEILGGFYRAEVVFDVDDVVNIKLFRREHKGATLVETKAKIIEIFCDNPMTGEQGKFVLKAKGVK